MNTANLILRGVAVLVLAAGVLVTPAAGQQSRYYQGQVWEQLFNGKDLTGWKIVGKEKLSVDDGTILGESGAGGDGFLVTERKFKDFELHVRFKVEGPGNSGVFYHTTIENDKFAGGMQVEVDRTINRHTGGLHEPYGRGWVVWPAPENETAIKPDDWNDLLVKVVANRVITRLNGVLMVDFTDPNPKNSDGVIGFQIHSGGGGKIRFKDVWIRDLSVRK